MPFKQIGYASVRSFNLNFLCHITDFDYVVQQPSLAGFPQEAKMKKFFLALVAAMILAACGGIPTTPTNDNDGVDTDRDNDGVEDGVDDPVVFDGYTVLVHDSIVHWVGPVRVYGYGTEGGWATSVHQATTLGSPLGDLWYAYDFYPYGNAECSVFRVNFGLSGEDGGDGYENWADLDGAEARADELVWVNQDGSRALCFEACDGGIRPPTPTTCAATY